MSKPAPPRCPADAALPSRRNLLVGLGLWWLQEQTPLHGYENVPIKAAIYAAWALGGAFIAFYCVNAPHLAEFMIITESELRKVTWPTRRQLIASTKIVIFLTFLLALILAAVDFGFLGFFKWIGIS